MTRDEAINVLLGWANVGAGDAFDSVAARADVDAARAVLTDSAGPIPIGADPELFHGLTIVCGGPGRVTVAAQLRTNGNLAEGADALALHLGPGAVRSSEDGHPAILSLEDARRLRDLLNVATARGHL